MILDIRYSTACKRWYTTSPTGAWRFIESADVGTIFKTLLVLADQAWAEFAEKLSEFCRRVLAPRVRRERVLATLPADGRIRRCEFAARDRANRQASAWGFRRGRWAGGVA